MIDIKDIAILSLTDLCEGILDDIEVTMANDDKFLETQFFIKWSENSRNKAYWRPTKKGWVLQGDFVIKDIEDKKYYGPKIKTVKGNLYIINAALESIEGMFDENAVIEGSFTIQNCKNLNTLAGCPGIVDTFTIMECPKIKSLANSPVVNKNLYAMKNGKKFNPDKLKDEVSVGKNIFCSAEEIEFLINEDAINESLHNPHLIRLAKQFKEPKYKKSTAILRSYFNSELSTSKWDINNVFKDKYLFYDKIDSASFKEYDGSDPKALTLARKCMANEEMFVLCMDKNGRYTYLIAGHNFIALDWNENDERLASPRVRVETSTKTLEHIIKNSDTVVFFDYKDEDRTYNLRASRHEAKQDALALKRGEELRKDKITAEKVRYYKDIAKENRERYKVLVAKMKAEKKLSDTSSTFEKLKARVDKVMKLYTDLMLNMIKSPEKYNSWDIEYISDSIKYVATQRFGSNKAYYEDGILVLLNKYISLYISSRKGEYTQGRYADQTNVKSDLADIENRLQSKLTNVENKILSLINK